MRSDTRDEFGNPVDDLEEPGPAASRDALTGGIQGITDPPVRSDPAGETPTAPGAPASGSVGAGIPWNPGASQPSSAPAGQHWDANMANFVPDAAPTPTPGGQVGSAGGGNDALLAQIAQWASMPGADPSLASNPNYWVDAISSRGGLTDANRQYWQDAGVGPSAFFRNPNREGGGAQPAAAAAPAAPAQGGGGGSVGPNSGTNAYNEQMRQILLQQIRGLSAPTTAEDPEVAPAIGAFNTQSQRDQATNRDALAERFYAQGDNGSALNSGGFNTSVQQGLEKSAGDRANFTGSTILAVAQQKRSQLMQMLQTATQAGLTDAAQQIQAKIAELDANLRQQGISNQASQFTQAQGQQNAQFGDSLGMTYAQMLAQENRDALLAGLGG